MMPMMETEAKKVLARALDLQKFGEGALTFDSCFLQAIEVGLRKAYHEGQLDPDLSGAMQTEKFEVSRALDFLEDNLETMRAFIVESAPDSMKHLEDLVKEAIKVLPAFLIERKHIDKQNLTERLRDFAQGFDVLGETQSGNALRDAADLVEQS